MRFLVTQFQGQDSDFLDVSTVSSLTVNHMLCPPKKWGKLSDRYSVFLVGRYVFIFISIKMNKNKNWALLGLNNEKKLPAHPLILELVFRDPQICTVEWSLFSLILEVFVTCRVRIRIGDRK